MHDCWCFFFVIVVLCCHVGIVDCIQEECGVDSGTPRELGH